MRGRDKGIVDCLFNVDVDAPDLVYQRDESLEVDPDIVVDGYAKVVFDSFDGEAGTAPVVVVEDRPGSAPC